MPGRASTRSTRSARSSTTTTTTTTTTTRKSAGRTRASASQIKIPDEGPEISLRAEVAQIFNDAQSTTATQRKLQTLLRKVQERCCFEQPESKKKRLPQEEDFDEEEFNNEVTRCLLRVLNVKKGVQEADRVIRFLGLFLKNASDKGIHVVCYDRGRVLTMSRSPNISSRGRRCNRSIRHSHKPPRWAHRPDPDQHPIPRRRQPRTQQNRAFPRHTDPCPHYRPTDRAGRRCLLFDQGVL